MSQPPDELSALEHQITTVLRVGLVASASVLVVGLILMLTGVAAGERVIGVGLVCLMGVPVVRIAASFVDALRRHDTLLTWATGIVLTVMALTLAMSL